MSQCILLQRNSNFSSFLTQNNFSISHLTLLITSHFILWLLQTSCSIFIDIACHNHSRVFYACCTISMYFTVVTVTAMLKSAILMPKNSMCPILPLNKNYLDLKITQKYPNGKTIAGAAIALVHMNIHNMHVVYYNIYTIK